ncbi:hypothetical protein MSG34_19475 [Vibrio sp. 1CM2L]|uniref:hypothetical protein n=1 Tax=Vibrio sp. 1CM2L TaxID=2929166 RepID=UPI0020BECD9D|nr:hypothetical protein [Vibrio sp. 1CM2L]MCK8078344.1 hypothetical protein [Vibrio sp. 1CM2L]
MNTTNTTNTAQRARRFIRANRDNFLSKALAFSALLAHSLEFYYVTRVDADRMVIDFADGSNVRLVTHNSAVAQEEHA